MLSLMPDEAQLGAPARYSGGMQRLPAPGEAGPAYAEDSQCMPAGHPGLGVCRQGWKDIWPLCSHLKPRALGR